MKVGPAQPLVLGSASPRRRELLTLARVPHVVQAADIDESVRTGETPRDYLERIARTKHDAVRALVRAGSPGSVALDTGRSARALLVADTVVVAPGERILGKPRDVADAAAMLARLSGATHEVRTRFLLGCEEPEPMHAETVTTRVRFRALSEDEIRDYASTGEGLDKAGAYAVQGGAAAFVERIEGSYTGIVGLPLCEVVTAMRALGWL